MNSGRRFFLRQARLMVREARAWFDRAAAHLVVAEKYNALYGVNPYEAGLANRRAAARRSAVSAFLHGLTRLNDAASCRREASAGE